MFCKNVFISIATSASRLSVLNNAEWIKDSTTATFYAGLLKRKKWREKCVFDCFNDDTSFKVLQCDWNGPTLHLCPVNILSKWDLTHLYLGLWYLLLPREFVPWIEKRLWLWALTNRPSERSSKLACLVRMSGSETRLSLHKNAPDPSEEATLSTEDANMKLQPLFDFTAKLRIYGV